MEQEDWFGMLFSFTLGILFLYLMINSNSTIWFLLCLVPLLISWGISFYVFFNIFLKLKVKDLK